MGVLSPATCWFDGNNNRKMVIQSLKLQSWLGFDGEKWGYNWDITAIHEIQWWINGRGAAGVDGSRIQNSGCDWSAGTSILEFSSKHVKKNKISSSIQMFKCRFKEVIPTKLPSPIDLHRSSIFFFAFLILQPPGAPPFPEPPRKAMRARFSCTTSRSPRPLACFKTPTGR